MVEKVMREHPLPAFQGIVGWTGGRAAIHLPGRSPGAITNAMRKFATAGTAELIGDNPERYKLKDTEQPGSETGGETEGGQHTSADTNSGPAQANQADAAQPPADREAPQPDAAT
jgi:hypothetical protein